MSSTPEPHRRITAATSHVQNSERASRRRRGDWHNLAPEAIGAAADAIDPPQPLECLFMQPDIQVRLIHPFRLALALTDLPGNPVQEKEDTCVV